ncbi:hypothetical protein Q767_03520 [Flavobacterium enshiense DK69]|uniref:Uncharacterized protein n=1 Tax=Flavobacterium enshiense DK69 TaxID=1107311 RepID=A0A0A2MZC2_9FLAO|nr:hypothetical protein Q767_03520 [Flavobacterium enshiense DK69]
MHLNNPKERATVILLWLFLLDAFNLFIKYYLQNNILTFLFVIFYFLTIIVAVYRTNMLIFSKLFTFNLLKSKKHKTILVIVGFFFYVMILNVWDEPDKKCNGNCGVSGRVTVQTFIQ